MLPSAACSLLAFGRAQDNKKSNTGNVLVTTSASHVSGVSIDHELYEQGGEMKDQRQSYDQLKLRMAAFLKTISAHGPNARLKPVEDLIGSLSDSVRFDVGSLSPQLLQGMVRGIFLVANWPRLWNPLGDPGLFEYISVWLNEWKERYHGLPPPSDHAIGALRERVKAIHVELYPAVLRSAQFDLHAILKELLERGVPAIKGRTAEMPLTPRLATRTRNRRSILAEQPSLPPPLGPFMPVAIHYVSVGFAAGDDVDVAAGGGYVVDLHCEFLAKSPHAYLIKEGRGRFSPRQQVTLDATNKRAAVIPQEAKTFVFAYPLASALQEPQDDSCRMEDDDGASDGASATSDNSSALLADSRLSFLAFGGFVYFSAEGRVLSVNALTNGPGLEFSDAVTLPDGSGLRAALHEAERVQPVTIEALCTRGVRKFAWLAPGEDIGGVATEHGAFVYFYEESNRHLDCYLSVVQGKELQPNFYSSKESIEAVSVPRRMPASPAPPMRAPMPVPPTPAPTPSTPSTPSTPPPPPPPKADPAAASPTVSSIPRAGQTLRPEGPDLPKTVEATGEATQPAARASTLEVNVVAASAASMVLGLILGGGLALAVIFAMEYTQGAAQPMIETTECSRSAWTKLGAECLEQVWTYF